MSHLRQRKGSVRGCLAPLVGIALVLAAVGLLYLGRYLYRMETKIFEGLSPAGASGPAYALSPAQQQAVDTLGWPEAFTLLFYGAEDEGGVVPARYEVWTYYTAGREIAFLDGDLAEDRAIEAAAAEVTAARYRPVQFAAGMNLRDVIDSAGLDSVLSSAVEQDLVAGGELFYAAELVFGTKDGRLAYVQALALLVEGQP